MQKAANLILAGLWEGEGGLGWVLMSLPKRHQFSIVQSQGWLALDTMLEASSEPMTTHYQSIARSLGACFPEMGACP